MAASGESHDPARALLALGLHPLLRSGPGCGAPWGRSTGKGNSSLWHLQQPQLGPACPSRAGCLGRVSPRAPAASPPLLLRVGRQPGCVGGELRHCGSWEAARGLVRVPAAEILTRPRARGGSAGARSRGQEQHARTAGSGAPGCQPQQQSLCSRHPGCPLKAPH